MRALEFAMCSGFGRDPGTRIPSHCFEWLPGLYCHRTLYAKVGQGQRHSSSAWTQKGSPSDHKTSLAPPAGAAIVPSPVGSQSNVSCPRRLRTLGSH